MLDIIKDLIQKYNPKSYGRLASCRPELLLFLKEWNKIRNCQSIAEQFYCINYNIEPPKCDCGDKLLFNTFILGYRLTCGSTKCKYKSQSKSITEFWENNPEKKIELLRKKRENYNSEEQITKRKINSINKEIQKQIKISKREEQKLIKKLEYNQQVIQNRIQTRRQLSSSYQRNINEIKPYTYIIKFIPTNQVYYGVRSKNVELGLTPLQDFMFHYKTSSKQIKKLIKENGISSFKYEIRRTFDTQEQAYYWEQTVLRRCKVVSDPRWLNQNAGGYIVPTESGRKKISITHKGKPKSEEQRKRISEANKGKPKSEEARKNMSIAQKKLNRVGENHPLFGTHRTEEQNKLQSEKMKGRKSPLKGKPLPEEVKLKISKTKKEKVYTDEEIQKLRENQLKGHLGKRRSIETRKRMSAAAKGKPKSEEARKNMSIARTGKKHKNGGPKGERAATSKLTEKQVLEIRDRYKNGGITQKQLGIEYGVSDPVISYIINRKTWKHI